MPRKPQDLAARFWSKVDQSGGPDACWPWIKGRRPEPQNYGRFKWVDPTSGRQESINASRVAFYLVHGYLPKVACHTCDNPPCCNPYPKHIYDGTHATNGADKAAHGRGRGKPNQRGEDNTSAILTDAVVLDARRSSKAGETQKSIAARYGVQIAVLGYAIRGQTWTHLDEIEAPFVRRIGGATRLTEDTIRAIRREREAGATYYALGPKYDMTPSNVRAICLRKSWAHVK